MKILYLCISLFLLFAASSLSEKVAHAQSVAPQARTFPADTAWGVLVMGFFPDASLEGRSVRFAPGARIRNEANVIVTPASVQQPVAIRYRLDPFGLIIEAWILNSAERDAASRASRPRAPGSSSE